MLSVNGTDRDVFIPYGPGTCASPLTDSYQLQYLKQPDRFFKDSSPVCTGSPEVLSRGDVDAEFEWVGSAFEDAMFPSHESSRVRNGFRISEWTVPEPCAAKRGRQGLVCEERITRLFTLQRNFAEGVVQRVGGSYDVLAVTRGTHGMKVGSGNGFVAAVDRTAGLKVPGPVPLVTITTCEGCTRLVHAGEEALLSLGRGVLADPFWLGSSFLGDRKPRLVFISSSDPRSLSRAGWTLGASITAESAVWLPNIARVMCEPPMSSFVEDRRLCDGLNPTRPSEHSPRMRYMAGLPDLSTSSGALTDDIWSVWVMLPQGIPTARNCARSWEDRYWCERLPQPIWLLGRGSRELHVTGSGSEMEAELGRRLSTCMYDRSPQNLSFHPGSEFDVKALIRSLSETYSRNLFQTDPPADPVDNNDLILAIMAIAPEAAALVLLMVQGSGAKEQSRQGRCSEWVALVVVLVVGAVALMGIGFLDKQEHDGHAWRAAASQLTKKERSSEPEDSREPSTPNEFPTQYVWYSETLFVVARPGYRPFLTRSLLLFCAIAYVLLSMIAVTSGLLARRRKTSPNENGESGCADDRLAGSINSDAPQGRPRRWRRLLVRVGPSLGAFHRRRRGPCTPLPEADAGTAGGEGADMDESKARPVEV